MSWSNPRTWTTGEVVTKTIMDAHVRDNLNETAPAKVTTAGDLVYATGANALTRLALGVQGAVLYSNTASNRPEYTTSLILVSTGEVQMPDTPAFLARKDSGTGNATGDGTLATVDYDAESFDQGADFNLTTETFTAPVGGRYRLSVILTLSTLGAAHTTGDVQIITSNRSYIGWWNPYAVAATDGVSLHSTICLSVLADMDANDTAYVTARVNNVGKTVSIAGLYNFFSGQLEC